MFHALRCHLRVCDDVRHWSYSVAATPTMEPSPVSAAVTSGDGQTGAPPSSSQRATNGSTSTPKVVYFIRHAESAYNAYKLNPINWLTLAALRDPLIFDPPLSPTGLTQLHTLTATAVKWKLTQRAQLLVVSPLKRAIDTALAVMGQQPTNQQQRTQPVDECSPHPLPVYVSALCSEVVDTSADIGSPPSVLSSVYPSLSFSHLSDAWWYHADPQQPRAISDEPEERVAHRVSSFLQWLCGRDERCIVVVSHSSFIRRCTGARLKIGNCQVQECTVAQQSDGRIEVRIVREALR